MKIRSGFVSNSSSSSFVIGFDKKLTNEDKFLWLKEILGDNIQFYTNVNEDSEQVKNFYDDFEYLGSSNNFYKNIINSYVNQLKNNQFNIGFNIENYTYITRKNWNYFKKKICEMDKEWNDMRAYYNHFCLSWRRFKKSEIKRIKENIEYYTNLMLKFKNKELYNIEFIGSGDASDVYFIRNDWIEGKTSGWDDLYRLYYRNKLNNIEKYIIEFKG